MPHEMSEVIAEAMRRLERGQTPEERAAYEAERAERERVEHERARAYRAELERRQREAVVATLPLTDDDRRRIVSDELDETHALRVVKRWLEVRASPWLVLLGGTGTGKTVAACYAAARECGTYISATRLRPLLTRAVWDGEEMPREALSSLVVLDDIGAEREADADKFRAVLCELLNARQGMRTRMIITSNLTRSRLGDASLYGERVVDRLNHCARVVELKGATMRGKGGGL